MGGDGKPIGQIGGLLARYSQFGQLLSNLLLHNLLGTGTCGHAQHLRPYRLSQVSGWPGPGHCLGKYVHHLLAIGFGHRSLPAHNVLALHLHLRPCGVLMPEEQPLGDLPAQLFYLINGAVYGLLQDLVYGFEVAG